MPTMWSPAHPLSQNVECMFFVMSRPCGKVKSNVSYNDTFAKVRMNKMTTHLEFESGVTTIFHHQALSKLAFGKHPAGLWGGIWGENWQTGSV